MATQSRPNKALQERCTSQKNGVSHPHGYLVKSPMLCQDDTACKLALELVYNASNGHKIMGAAVACGAADDGEEREGERERYWRLTVCYVRHEGTVHFERGQGVEEWASSCRQLRRRGETG